MRLFRKIKVKDSELSSVQDAVGLVLNQITKNAIVDGILINADLVTGENKVSHKLSRIPQGWIIVDRDSAATVYRTAWDSSQITLTSSGSLTATLYVF